MPPTDTRRRRCLLSHSLTHSFMVSRSWNFLPPLSKKKVDVDWFSSDVPILYFSGLNTKFVLLDMFFIYIYCDQQFKLTTAERIYMRKDRGRQKNWKIIQLCSRKKKKLISIFMYLLHKRFILKISSREQREKNLCDLKTCFDHFCKNFFFHFTLFWFFYPE